MKDITAHWMMLDFLNEGKLTRNSVLSCNLKLYEKILPNGMGKERPDFAVAYLEIGRLILVTIDHCRNGTAGAELLDGIATDFGAGPGGKLYLFSHEIRWDERMVIESMVA